MHENVRDITELIANYRFKGSGHTALEPTGVDLFMSCSLLDSSVLL